MKKSNVFLIAFVMDIILSIGLYYAPNFVEGFEEIQPYWYIPLIVGIPAIFLYFKAKKQETKID